MKKNVCTIKIQLNLVYPETARIHLWQDNGAYKAGDAGKPATVPGLPATHTALTNDSHRSGGWAEDGILQEYILTELDSR